MLQIPVLFLWCIAKFKFDNLRSTMENEEWRMEN